MLTQDQLCEAAADMRSKIALAIGRTIGAYNNAQNLQAVAGMCNTGYGREIYQETNLGDFTAFVGQTLAGTAPGNQVLRAPTASPSGQADAIYEIHATIVNAAGAALLDASTIQAVARTTLVIDAGGTKSRYPLAAFANTLGSALSASGGVQPAQACCVASAPRNGPPLFAVGPNVSIGWALEFETKSATGLDLATLTVIAGTLLRLNAKGVRLAAQ